MIEDLLFSAYFVTGFYEKPLIIHYDYCLAGELQKFPFRVTIQSLEIFSIGYLKFIGILTQCFLPNIPKLHLILRYPLLEREGFR